MKEICPKCQSKNLETLSWVSMDMLPPIVSRKYRCKDCWEEFYITEKES